MKNFLKVAVFVRSKANLRGRAGIYVYALVSGIVAALIAICFQSFTHLILALLTATDGVHVVESFSSIEPWRRIMSLTLGGILSGIILLFAAKKISKKSTPYMEAVAIGNGYIPVRATLLRSLAAIVTIGSGTSIGREGPLVQTVAVFASLLGRWTNLSTPRLRLFIACAAAGAMSAVFHTPLAGGLFVCEIVIGVMSIDVLAPLLVASCASYFTLNIIGDTSPLYEIENAHLNINATILLGVVILGVLSSVLAKLWLFLLSYLRKKLNRGQTYLPLRLALVGLAVGTISIWFPEVVGNGAHIIRGIVNLHFTYEDITLLLFLKIIAVALFFGVGAVGGVLTPSLTIGGISGFLTANLMMAMGVPLTPEEVIGFSILGMAAFFTTAAGAPLTSLMLVVEFTMAGRMIFPLIIGVLMSYGVSKILSTKSMYASATSGGMRSVFNKPINEVKIKDIFRKVPETIGATTLFKRIAKIFIKNPDYSLYVLSGSKKYIGAIMQTDVLEFLRSDALSSKVIAMDILRTDVPTLNPEEKIMGGIEKFVENKEYEALPIVNGEGKFEGVVNRSDIFMCFNEIVRRDRVDG